MTTIAFRDGVLAADTMVSNRGTNVGAVVKIFQRSDGQMAASIGDLSYAQKFISWFLGGEVGEPPLPKLIDGNDEGQGYIFRGADEIVQLESGGPHSLRAEYWAAGSGRDLALGAMATGASPEDAVKAAIAHDTCTGGDVTVLSFDGFLPTISHDELGAELPPRHEPLRQRLGLDA